MPHPDYLLQVLTASQLREWEVFDRIEPVGEHRQDIRIGIICSLVKFLADAIHGKKGRKAKMANPHSFIPWIVKDKEELEELELEDMDPLERERIAVEKIKAMFGG